MKVVFYHRRTELICAKRAFYGVLMFEGRNAAVSRDTGHAREGAGAEICGEAFVELGAVVGDYTVNSRDDSGDEIGVS